MIHYWVMKIKTHILYSYIYDFLSIVFEKVDLSKYVRNIILFGSVARGDYGKESDIDIFFDIKDKKFETQVEYLLKESLKTFEIKSDNSWKLKNINLPIKYIAGDLKNKKWNPLRTDLISYGISLYGKFENDPKDINHFVLINYKLSNLERKQKMKFIRELFGYNNLKKDKKYSHQGIIESIGGKKLSTNSLLIPISEVKIIKEIMKKYNVTPLIKEIWIK